MDKLKIAVSTAALSGLCYFIYKSLKSDDSVDNGYQILPPSTNNEFTNREIRV